METTLTGHSEQRMMADARAAGYKITLVYVGLADALTSLARVRERQIFPNLWVRFHFSCCQGF